ncbi:MAG TPA: hypothetical protein VHP30_01265 [Ignavibacteriales bacterium]|nr:hypothetical protein [Ignavibacteriales bacterium]
MKYLKIAQADYGIKVPPGLIAVFINNVIEFLNRYPLNKAVGKALNKLSLR